MKAWEALQILESLPADTEVTLTIGRKGGTPPSSLPKWAQVPYPRSNEWVIDKTTWPVRPPFEITCKNPEFNDMH